MPGSIPKEHPITQRPFSILPTPEEVELISSPWILASQISRFSDLQRYCFSFTRGPLQVMYSFVAFNLPLSRPDA